MLPCAAGRQASEGVRSGGGGVSGASPGVFCVQEGAGRPASAHPGPEGLLTAPSPQRHRPFSSVPASIRVAVPLQLIQWLRAGSSQPAGRKLRCTGRRGGTSAHQAALVAAASIHDNGRADCE